MLKNIDDITNSNIMKTGLWPILSPRKPSIQRDDNQLMNFGKPNRRSLLCYTYLLNYHHFQNSMKNCPSTTAFMHFGRIDEGHNPDSVNHVILKQF